MDVALLTFRIGSSRLPFRSRRLPAHVANVLVCEHLDRGGHIERGMDERGDTFGARRARGFLDRTRQQTEALAVCIETEPSTNLPKADKP